jgi:glycosyltransferase involved in cell wall biosynthesis
MTRRLLIVAPAFPPHPSPATHRSRFLARYGAEFGWDVEVATVAPRHYEGALDHELERLLPNGLCISRAAALPASWTRRVGVGDLGIRAYLPMRRLLRRLCRERRPDLLFLPGWPFFTFRLGADIREEFGVPYMLDYTDPWIFPTTPGIDKPWKKAFWAHRLASLAEPRAIRNASHILAVSEGTNESIRRYYPDLPADRFSAVPFGFETSDFEVVRHRTNSAAYWDAHDGQVHAVYVGVIPPDAEETLRALFLAVTQLRRESPELGSKLRVHFVGTTYDPYATKGAVAPIAAEMGLGAVVTEHVQRIPYLDALQLLSSADLILGLGTTARHYTASKIFPCILAGRPLLSIYHRESSVCEIVSAARAGTLVVYDDAERASARVSEITSALERAVRGWSLDAGPRTLEAIERFSARSACRHIYQTCDHVIGRGGASPVMGQTRREAAAHV